MDIFEFLKGVLRNMPKVQIVKPGEKISSSVLGKRKLDYTYFGFISSTVRPPLASPTLDKNCGVKSSGKTKK